jgi:NADPH-dependent ferric siderophore reductase
MAWVNCNPTKQEEQAYRALQTAAERMGMNNYKTQLAAHLKKRRSKNTFKFFVTAEHELVIESMKKVLKKEITPEQAMSLLWQHDIKMQRLGS